MNRKIKCHNKKSIKPCDLCIKSSYSSQKCLVSDWINKCIKINEDKIIESKLIKIKKSIRIKINFLEMKGYLILFIFYLIIRYF